MKTENKKLYIAPKMECFCIEPQVLMSVSGVRNTEYDIDYGGSDDWGNISVD